MEKIYVSLTSIFQKQDTLLLTLKSIYEQTLKPNKIFIYLSDEPFLLDVGFINKNITNKDLENYLNENSYIFELNWVKNTGPYRKLLPLLKKKWDEDCIIITVDDDVIYDNNLIYNLFEDYKKYNCVINYRGFTPKIISLDKFNYFSRKNPPIEKHLYNFPTGIAGVLYHPKFFHKTDDLIFNDEIYLKNLPTADDIWFYLVRICNNIDCFIKDYNFMIKNITNKDISLYKNYNNNNNTHNFLKILEIFKKNNYIK